MRGFPPLREVAFSLRRELRKKAQPGNKDWRLCLPSVEQTTDSKRYNRDSRESKWKKFSTNTIEKLPEGIYLATTDDLPGLVVQGKTIAETLEIARDVAQKLLEARAERSL